MKLTAAEIDELRYAARNHGRNFVTPVEGEPRNEAINRMTAMGLFVDGGPSTFGRWRELTAAGRAMVTAAKGE